ncbi:Kelch repeat-containing protein [Bacillus altitudinis]|uniref:Kelch repeat-containing protein n=1 Tax=Bacillus altitudinis TaxID=293387 RepID=UPI00201E40E0|nr:kelch repeat-containing protein [Bacillus altitudinis]MEE4391566.1 kelch repeat-containing protein [Bacillus altitudinis]
MIFLKKLGLIFFLLISSLIYPLHSVKADTVEWKEQADLPDARVGASSGVVDGKIYIIGGQGPTQRQGADQTFVYDPEKNEWSSKTSMPTPRYGAATATLNDQIYVVGGLSPDGAVKTVEVYNTKNDSWEKLEDIPLEAKVGPYRIYAESAKGKIFVVAIENYRMSTYCYDPNTKKWDKKSTLDYIVTAGTLNSINGKLYLSGGNEALNKMIGEYDPDTDTWMKKQGGWSAGYYATAVYNNKVLLTGGTARLSVHDVMLGTRYSVQTPKTFYRKGHSAAIVNDNLYIIGGEENTNGDMPRAREKFKSVISLSLKDALPQENNTETPGNKDPEPTTPPKDDTTDENGDALLIITMVNGLQKEYDLSMKEVNAFLSWYKKRDAGEGPGFYEIDEHDNNKGPFESKKDYVVFNNILMFEVNKYKK